MRYVKHGHCVGAVAHGTTPTYMSWAAMKHRCYYPHAINYHLYGGRGIRVCDRWRESFADFLADVGERPSPAHSLDRINNDGHYEPGNVRWATHAEQDHNKRVNHRLTANGETLTVTQWAKRLHTTPQTIMRRIKMGWPIERVVSAPVRHYGLAK